jgi:hypothetical protein
VLHKGKKAMLSINGVARWGAMWPALATEYKGRKMEISSGKVRFLHSTYFKLWNQLKINQ